MNALEKKHLPCPRTRRCRGHDRKRRSMLGISVAVLVLLFGTVTRTDAALLGDTVTFNLVSTGLWGEASVYGDQLRFTPNAFRATQPGGPGIDFAASTLIFDIEAIPGYYITGIDLTEWGDSLLFGGGVTVVDGDLTVGTSTMPLSFTYGNIFFGPGGLAYDDPPWEATASFDFSTTPLTQMRVVLENELLSVAPDMLDFADIDKALSVFGVTTIIPEPTSIFLLGSGIVGLAMLGARRKRVDT